MSTWCRADGTCTQSGKTREMWSKSGKGNVFIEVNHTWSYTQTAEHQPGNDPQKLLFICGDLLMVGQMGRALRGGAKSWSRMWLLWSVLASAREDPYGDTRELL